MQLTWKLRNQPENSAIEKLRSTLKVDPTIARLLLQRDIQTFEAAEDFFRPKKDQIHDPKEMKNMAQAVELLLLSIEKKERILLYGDYDVDGTCSVSMMYTFLKGKVEHLFYYVPDRYEEGYGVSERGIDYALEHKIDLLITLDCGVKNVSELNRAKLSGIKVLVCDHHEPGDELPKAIVLNPKQKDCPYPFKELCGCGVGYKLLSALAEKKPEWQEEVESLLDFVAVSIGADIVSVTGENRALAYLGMKQMNEAPRLSFKSILESANKAFPVTLTDVVFGIAPRINAAGRIYHASSAVELLLSEDPQTIRQCTEEIEAYNAERRLLDEQTTSEALALLDEKEFQNSHVNLVYKEGWSKGVVGIVASRIIEQRFKPTIVLSCENEILTGSARTTNDFDIHHALVQCEDLFLKFGGHTHAAGLSLMKKDFPEFRKRLNQWILENISQKDQSPVLLIDQVIRFSDLFHKGESIQNIPRLKRILDQMEPHGPGNLKPIFVSEELYATKVQVLKEKHLKISVCQADFRGDLPAIGFNMADKVDLIASGLPFSMAYTLETNTWNNKSTLQLNIKDIQEATIFSK